MLYELPKCIYRQVDIKRVMYIGKEWNDDKKASKRNYSC